MADNNPQTLPARHANGRFGPGNPGRRPGSKNRSAQAIAQVVFDDFEANHAKVLQGLRFESPGEYMRLVTRLLPKPAETVTRETSDWTEEERVRAYHDAKALLSIEVDPSVALAGLEAVLLGGPPEQPEP